MKKHKKLIKRIENLIEYYQHCEDHHLEMFDRMVERFPHLKGALGDNITQAEKVEKNIRKRLTRIDFFLIFKK